MTIDWWTLGLEAVNVAVLMWLLGHFFWKPVAAMIEQRRTAATRDLDAAAARRAEADKALAVAAAARAGLAKERIAALADANAEADKARAAILAQAKADAEAARAAATAAVARERAEAMAAMRGDAAALAVDIAARLLGRLDGAAVRTAFLGGLVNKVATLSEAQRQALAAAPLRLVCGSSLGDAEQAQCRAALEGALGAPLHLTFDVDPKLVAGMALESANLIVADNWRADLDRILSEIRHD